MRRFMLALAAAAVLAAGTAEPKPARAATAATAATVAATNWCFLYCDSIYLGCKALVGKVDEEACKEWRKGCLEGCKVQ